MPTPTAPLLAPYTSLPPHKSVTQITTVLGATGNWLLLRFLSDVLSPSAATRGGHEGLDGRRDARTKVVLVSFLRGWEFWRAEGRRVGLDIAKLSNQGAFAFIDGLSELFSAPHPSTASTASSSTPATTARGPPQHGPTARAPAATAIRPETVNQSRMPGPQKLRWSSKGGLEALERDIVSVMQNLTSGDGESQTLLVLDQPDLLLAATGPSMGVGATEMGEFIMGLRQNAHSTILTMSADAPLIHNSSTTSGAQQPTPLEIEHAALVVGTAHQARTVMQLRGLDTGVARDVSGVLRISKGGGWVPKSGGGGKGNEVEGDGDLEEKELLYFVQADGAVRVFGRGEAA